MSRDKLIAYLWPDRDTAHGRNLLSQAIHAVRKTLGSDTIRSAADELRLDPAFVSCDVLSFRDALAAGDRVAAVELYRGPLLDGFFLPEAPGFERWLDAERQQLAISVATSIEGLAEEAEGNGDLAAGVQWWHRLHALDPCSARVVIRLMTALEATGDRAAAIRQADAHAAFLEEELGARPNPEVVALAEQMRSGQPTTRGMALATAATASEGRATRENAVRPPSEVPRLVSPTLHLVGRDAESARLREAWRTAQGGGIHMALISGEAGIGKTRLAEELLDQVTGDGIPAARTRSYEAEGRLAYAPVVEWLRSEPLRGRLATLDAVWLTELSRLLPEARAGRPGIPAPEPLGESWQRQRLFEALTHVILLEPGPLLLLLDDLPWSDPETIQWLHYLMRYPTKARLLVVGTARTEEVTPEHPMSALVRELRRRRQLTEIVLEPLDEEATTALASQVAGRQLTWDEASELHRETEGHPLFIVESVRAQLEDAEAGGSGGPRAGSTDTGAAASLPPTVQAVIQSRLAQLSPSTRRLAGLAAIVGREFTTRVLAHASGTDDETLATGLDELWRRRIIRGGRAGTYDFSHDRLREAAQSGLSPARRRLFHRRVAEALETIHAADPDPVSGRVAAHFEHADAPVRALPYYECAAEVARRVFAMEEAIGHFRRAVSLLAHLPDGPERNRRELAAQIGLMMCYMSVRGWSAREVEEALTRANALSADAGDEQRMQILWCRHIMLLVKAPREGVAVTEELLVLARRVGDPTYLVAAHYAVGAQAYTFGEFSRAVRHLEEALAGLDQGEERFPTRLHAADVGVLDLVFLSHALWHLGHIDQALARSREAIAVAEEMAHPLSQAVALAYAAMLHQYRGEPDEAARLAEATREVCSEYDFPYYLAWSTIISGWATAERGAVEEGLARMRSGLDAMDEMGATVRRPYYMGLLADASGRLGRTTEALGRIDDALALVPRSGDRWVLPELHRKRGGLLQASGRTGEAEESLRRSLAVAREQEARASELRAAVSLARLALERGDAEEELSRLRRIYDRFTEGRETPLLEEAAALLDGRSRGRHRF